LKRATEKACLAIGSGTCGYGGAAMLVENNLAGVRLGIFGGTDSAAAGIAGLEAVGKAKAAGYRAGIAYTGVWTRHGDERAVRTIRQMTKTEACDLGEFLGVPDVILDSKPGWFESDREQSSCRAVGARLSLHRVEMSRSIGEGFDYNGPLKQLRTSKFRPLIAIVANQVEKPKETVERTLQEAPRTVSRRKQGSSVANLLPGRKETAFPEVGTDAFNTIYLKSIRELTSPD
jgi:hypothetical protein